jgi:hypothetical protein
MREKRWNTPKNGAYYPRIQSILGFFLMIFWWWNIKLFCVRRRENYVREKKLCVIEVCVSFSVCSRLALATCSPTAGPPLHVERSSSGHFPPPRAEANQIQTVLWNYNKRTFIIPIFDWLLLEGGSARPTRHLLYLKWAAPTPPPQRKTRKTLKIVKIAKNYIFL